MVDTLPDTLPDAGLVASPPIVLPAGRHGSATGAAGVTLRVVTGRALVSVIARKGTTDAIARAAKAAFGFDLPARPVMARGGAVSFLWSGHAQWLAMAGEASHRDLLSTLRTELDGLASLSDQSDARCIVELAGTAARATLAKLTPVDLHPRAFQPNDTAMTLFGHISGQLTQISEAPAYELAVFRSFAGSFVESVLDAGAEYGVDAGGR